MPSNRALVVDDSRSARHILSRMLESFGLEVDAVESAELALTYLQTTRPDVIFMDHLMPGMDGFAAVRVIKANPDTATIPVLMYTSQEGEMYLSQARALGAMGVLPKTLKHADVAEALQHLNLHTDTAIAAAPAKPRVSAPEREPVAVVSSVPAEPLPAAALSAEQAVAAMSTAQLAHRIATEVHAEILRTNTPESSQRWRRAALLTGCAALVLLCAVIYQQNQLYQQLVQLQSAQQQLGTRLSMESAAATPVAVAAPPPVAATPASVSAARIETEGVPYGEVPLSGARLEKLRELVAGMRSEQIQGTVRVETFMGDFCLSGSLATGYELADDELLVSRCDLVGNPFGDALTVQQRQSVAFANLVASLNSDAAGGIRVQVVDGAHQPVVAYPAPSQTLTAAAWNAVAERNQRVEFTVPTAP